MALKKEITAKIRDLLRQNPQGLNITAIVHNININRNTAGRYLENLMVSGQVEMRQFGMAKIYRLAQRVPLSAMLSISSELIMLLDRSMRVIYANDPLLQFCGTARKDLYGKNIEYTPFVTVFDDAFDSLKKQIRAGISGKEWYGELSLQRKGVVFACRITPVVFEEGQRGVSVLLENITERKQAERTIQESERQFRLLAENSLDMIHRHTPDDVCIYISPASKTILGYDPDELIGRPVSEVLHPDDAHIVPEYKSRLNRKNHTAKISCRARHRDGHYVWLESVLQAIFDDKTGEFVEIYGVTRDITEQKKADIALHESEDRYRSLVEISPDPVILHRNGKIVYMNPVAFRLIGASPSDAVIGKNILDFIHPDFRNVVKKNINKDLQGDRTPPTELTMVRIDGTPVVVEGRGVRTIIDGKPAVQVAIRDITGRKKAEQALRQSEARFRSYFDMPLHGIAITSPEKGWLQVNDRICSILGYTRDEIVRLTWEEMTHPDDLAADSEQFNRLLCGEIEQYTLDKRFIRKDGRVIWTSIAVGCVRKPDGTVDYIVGLMEDITGRKRAEQAMRESEATARALINAPTDSILLLDAQGVILDLNETAALRFGKRRGELIGVLADSVIPTDIARARRSMISQVYDTRSPVRFEDERNGVWYDTVAYPVIDEAGEVKKVAVIARDITNRMRTEEALRQSEGKLHAMLQSITDPMTMMDENLTIIWANDTAKRYFGADIVGRKCYEAFHQRQNPCEPSPCLTLKAFGDGKMHRHETTVIDREGTTRFFDCTANVALRDEHGRPTAVLEISRDCTDLKRAKEALHKGTGDVRHTDAPGIRTKKAPSLN